MKTIFFYCCSNANNNDILSLNSEYCPKNMANETSWQMKPTPYVLPNFFSSLLSDFSFCLNIASIACSIFYRCCFQLKPGIAIRKNSWHPVLQINPSNWTLSSIVIHKYSTISYFIYICVFICRTETFQTHYCSCFVSTNYLF